MHRSSSCTSLFTMSQFPEFEQFNQGWSQEYLDEDLPPDAQPLPPGAHEFGLVDPTLINQPSDSLDENESEEPPPLINADTNFADIVFTNTNDIRSYLASTSHFTGGQLGMHLLQEKGLIILPLHAVTCIRTIAGHHKMEYPAIIFYPQQKTLEEYTEIFPNLVDAVTNLYSQQ